MSLTKRQFVAQAFSELGAAVYVFDLQPEQLEDALRRLDSMMGLWYSKGIRIGWPLHGTPADSRLDEDSNAPDSAEEAITLNLAIRIAPSLGKTIAPTTAVLANQAYDQLLNLAAQPVERQMPYTMPMGAGNRHNGCGYSRPPCNPVLVGPDGTLDLT